VLLLPFKSGANGLNVTEATRVFLCEPLLNVGVEQQVDPCSASATKRQTQSRDGHNQEIDTLKR